MVQFVDDVMRETAKSLGKSLDSYWPSKVSDSCELPERNISLHCSLALANRGFSVLQELAFHDRPRAERLDVLAISPGHSFALHLEVKQYWNRCMDQSLDDLDRVKRFSINRDLDPEIFGRSFVVPLKALSCEVGVVAGALWHSTRQGVGLTGKKQEAFTAKVQELDGIICPEPHLIRRYTPAQNSAWDGAYYLYWAIVGDWRRKVDGDGKLI